MKLPKSIDRIPYSELRGENRLALPETFVLLFFACAVPMRTVLSDSVPQEVK